MKSNQRVGRIPWRNPDQGSGWRILAAALGLGAVLSCPAAHGTWYAENVANGSDIVMMDLRWPWWPSGTYFANWNSGFNPKPNDVSFYAGFTSFLPDGPGQTPNPDEASQRLFRPGSVWTFWGGDAAGTPVRFTDVAPNLFIKNEYGGEGSSGTLGGEVWPFVRCESWYTMLARVWQPVGGGPAFVARWIKDHADGRWHLIGVAKLPIAATSFTGNSGFLEPLRSEKAVRSLHRRLGYCRKDGQWQKADTITIDKTQYVVVNKLPEGDHEYVAIEYAQRPDLLPRQLTGTPLAGDAKHSFTTRQPDLPALDKPEIANVRAIASGGQIAVSWDVPPTASPAFSCRVEVFDNPRCSGSPKVVQEVRMPTLRDMLVAANVESPTVRLTVTDVFDQPTAAVVVTPMVVNASASPAVHARTLPGLTYEVFHKDTQRQENYFSPPGQSPDERHTWLMLDEIGAGMSVRRGLSRGFDLSVREGRGHGYAIVFEGLLRVPADGIYILRVQIDGGYRFELDGRDVLTWDGQHGTTEKAAVLALGKGDHPLVVRHLYDALPARNFSIDWEGPGFTRQSIPLESLRVVDDGSFPTVAVKGDAPGDGTGRVTVQVDAHGRTVNKTALFLGPLQLAAGEGGTLTYAGPLPRGVSTLWARVTYAGTWAVDSAPLTLDVGGKPVAAEWTVRNVSDAKASAGVWQARADSFQFFGNGMHTVTKRVTGDFTATCRLDGYSGSEGEPVNRRAWAGLAAMEHGDRRDWNWGRHFHLVQTAGDGLRASPDFTDFGAGRITSYRLPDDRPWLRIARQGQIWTAWTSVDGRHWDLGANQFKQTEPQVDVGLFFSALPQDARAHYHARVSAFSIEPGLAADLNLPLPPTARHTDGDRLTGVVMARSDARVVVVRSSAAGVLRTTDGGETWTCLGAVGERVTSVVVWPWECHYPAPARGKTHLCVTTCPDRWLGVLGRGAPAVVSVATPSRAYVSHDDVKTIVVSDERDDTGFFNVAFDKALQSVNEMRYATAHGYQTQISPGAHMAIYPPQKSLEWFRPFTAVGAAALGDQKFGRFITQALDPAVPGRLSRSHAWAFDWHWLTPVGDVPAGGLIAVSGDVREGQRWWFVCTDGLYASTDGGVTLRRVLDTSGSVVRADGRGIREP